MLSYWIEAEKFDSILSYQQDVAVSSLPSRADFTTEQLDRSIACVCLVLIGTVIVFTQGESFDSYMKKASISAQNRQEENHDYYWPSARFFQCSPTDCWSVDDAGSWPSISADLQHPSMVFETCSSMVLCWCCAMREHWLDLVSHLDPGQDWSGWSLRLFPW